MAAVALVGLALVDQLGDAHRVIRSRAATFLANRQMGEWLADNAEPAARVFAAEPEINQYYSGLRSVWYPATGAEFVGQLGTARLAYLVVVSSSPAQPGYVTDYVERLGSTPVASVRGRGERGGRIYRTRPRP